MIKFLSVCELFEIASAIDLLLGLIGSFKFLRLIIMYDIPHDWEGSIWLTFPTLLACVVVSIYTFITPGSYGWITKIPLTLCLVTQINFIYRVRKRSFKRDIFHKHIK